MTGSGSGVESDHLRATHLAGRSPVDGMSVRAMDRRLRLDGDGHGLLDTTHFDTVRFPPPPWARHVVERAARDGANAYTAYRGDRSVLRGIAPAVSALLGVDLDPARHLALTPGTQGGLFATLAALVSRGDRVAVVDPDYLFTERMLAFLGARVHRVGLVRGPDGLQPDVEELDRLSAGGIRMLLMSHPNNPTGAVYGREEMARVAALAAERDFLVVVDELYCRLVYPGTTFVHLMALPGMARRCVTLVGPSKTESLSGYRIGVAVADGELIDAIEQMIAICALRAPAYAQHVLTRWLVDDVDFVRQRVRELHAIRDSTVARLREVEGLAVTPGPGTAYLFPDVRELGRGDVEVAQALQRDARVVVSPGYQFGTRGVGHFRICYARDEAQWSRALAEIVTALNRVAGAA